MKKYIIPEAKVISLLCDRSLANSFFNWDFNAIASNSNLEAGADWESNLEVPIEETNNPEGTP